MSSATNDKNLKKNIEHLKRALDDLVSVNSLFTFATFVGISFASSNPDSLELQKACQADHHTRMTLLVNEVVSFVCFLLSSLVATAFKMDVAIVGKSEEIYMDPVKSMMILVSTLGSVFGCIFLSQSMVDMVRVLLGKLGCMKRDTIQAAGSLIAINTLALAIYAPLMVQAIYLAYFNLQKPQTR